MSADNEMERQMKQMLQFFKENGVQKDVTKGIDVSGMLFLLKFLGFELIGCAKGSALNFPSPSTQAKGQSCGQFEIEIKCKESKANMLLQKSTNKRVNCLLGVDHRQANDNIFQNAPSTSSPNIRPFPVQKHEFASFIPVLTGKKTEGKVEKSNIKSTDPRNFNKQLQISMHKHESASFIPLLAGKKRKKTLAKSDVTTNVPNFSAKEIYDDGVEEMIKNINKNIDLTSAAFEGFKTSAENVLRTRSALLYVLKKSKSHWMKAEQKNLTPDVGRKIEYFEGKTMPSTGANSKQPKRNP